MFVLSVVNKCEHALVRSVNHCVKAQWQGRKMLSFDLCVALPSCQMDKNKHPVLLYRHSKFDILFLMIAYNFLSM